MASNQTYKRLLTSCYGVCTNHDHHLPVLPNGRSSGNAGPSERLSMKPKPWRRLYRDSLLLVSWLLLLLGVQQQACAQGDSLPETAYLVGSMQQSFEPSNSSFNNLRGILSSPHAYGTIVLAEDYAVVPGEFASDPVRLSRDLLITSPPGEFNQLTFSFLVSQ